ncbi:MAG: outer membrane lipoprotein-sorting protein [Candidatus Margulisbacteria bacterium]|nr:outer membrane lipoprotein-sorting protein [Candidatus Margulisiibacteriota bacterium]
MAFLICFEVGSLRLDVARAAWAITGEEIIKKVDANMTFKTARTEAKMVIHVDQEIREKTMIGYDRGTDTGYAEFLTPPRDKGVKYLKIKDNMWMYLPSVDKIIKISGAMLRQSLMGSDFSYEDALESSKLLEKYTATLISEEVVPLTFREAGELVAKQRRCYVVDLTAKVKDVTYYRRVVYVDKELFVPAREDLYAMSGKKLKEMTMGDVRKFGARHYPLYMTMRNLLRANSQTEMFTTKIEFDVAVDPKVFTQGNLTK